MSNKDLLYSTGNSIQYPVIDHNGKEYEGTSLVVEWFRICVPMQGIQVQSVARELRSHTPWGI